MHTEFWFGINKLHINFKYTKFCYI